MEEIRDHLPLALEHVLTGWPPPSPNAFVWRNGRVHYFLPSGGKSDEPEDRAAEPFQADWERFRAECDRIDVWSLPRDFRAPSVIDGLRVRTSLVYEDRAIHVIGQCAHAPADVKERVLALHRALQGLVGHQTATPR